MPAEYAPDARRAARKAQAALGVFYVASTIPKTMYLLRQPGRTAVAVRRTGVETVAIVIWNWDLKPACSVDFDLLEGNDGVDFNCPGKAAFKKDSQIAAVLTSVKAVVNA